MNLAALRNLTWYFLDDLSGGYFTSTQVNQWLNNAQREAQKKLIQAGQNWYVANPVQTYTVASQECYALPDDFLKLEHLECVISGTFPSEQKNVMNHSTHRESDVYMYQSGPPQTFFMQKNCLIVRPVPDLSTYLLRLHYTYLVQDMVYDTDVPDLPTQYHEYLSVLAAIDGKIKDERDASLLVAKKEWYEDQMQKDAIERLRDKPREVVITQDDSYGVLF